MTVEYKLSPQLIESSIKQIIRHEGKRLDVYLDTEGLETVGIGHLLTSDDPWQLGDTISEDECSSLFKKDWEQATEECIKFFESHNCWNNLTDTRKEVLINMTFNLGIPRLSKFKRMIKAIKNNWFLVASDEMKDSKWYHQVGSRADELIFNMRHGTS